MENACNNENSQEFAVATSAANGVSACVQDDLQGSDKRERTASPAKMSPVSPKRRAESPSLDNLKSSSESLDGSGLCNEAFDDGRNNLKENEESVTEGTADREETLESRLDSIDLHEAETPSASAVEAPNQNCTTPNSTSTSQSQAHQNISGPYNNSIGHSRGPSAASVGPLTAKDICHSRGESTDGSTIDAYTSSATESRRGTYSEAGTLPVGMLHEGSPIIEENGGLSEKIVEKKLSNGSALPADSSRRDRLKYALSCPPHGKVGRFLTWCVFLLFLWGSLVYITGPMALPHGTLFSLLVLVVTAEIGGRLVAKLRLPPLLGMLLVGIIYRSVDGIDIIGRSIDTTWSSSLRSMALVVILIRAGLGLDPKALRKLSFVVLRLAMMPCTVETFTVAIVSHFVLGFPWKWGFMLGFILAAVSPAVVVPCLLNLSDQGYGVDKGIPTLVIAAASVDDVLAISGFGVMLGMTFSKGSPLWQGFKGPLELLIGVVYGVVVGVVLWSLPHRHEKNATIFRFLTLFSVGLFAIFASKGIGFSGAGALGCLCVAFVAGVGWRNQGWPDEGNQVADYFNLLWKFFQPMLFGLIGTEIRVAELDVNTIGWGIVTLCVGLTLRVVVSFFAVLGGGLNIRERFFVALAWLPKATVQAAIGSTALDTARGSAEFSTGPPCPHLFGAQTISNLTTTTEDVLGETSTLMPATGLEFESCEVTLGKQVLTIAVLVILITAPIGAAAIMLSAPKLLKRTPPHDHPRRSLQDLPE